MLGEFSEEYLQEILDPVFRHITLKTEEEMNLLSPDALYAGFLGALFGTGVESVDAAINGLSAESTAMDSSTKDSDYAEFADILNEPEDLENFKYLASLPKAEQEAFVETLFEEAPVVDDPAAEEIPNPEAEISRTENLPVEESRINATIKMVKAKESTLRTILNEIDAKQYLLDNAQKYKIPRNEIELTRKQLEGYKKQLEEYGGK